MGIDEGTALELSKVKLENIKGNADAMVLVCRSTTLCMTQTRKGLR